MRFASVATSLTRSPSTITIAFVHTFPWPSHSLPNLTTFNFLACVLSVAFSCANADIDATNITIIAAIQILTYGHLVALGSWLLALGRGTALSSVTLWLCG